MRAAKGLELPAWILSLVTLLMIGVISLLNEIEAVRGLGRHHSHFSEVVLGGLAVLCIGWLLTRPPRPITARAVAGATARLPGGVHDLLVLVDGLIDQLERGEDRAFDLDATELGLTLDRLDAATCRFLEARGADCRNLRGVCSGDAELVEELSPDRRRAMHHELVRFATTARGRACGDPYRSRINAGPSLRRAIKDPALARTRRLFAVTVALIVVGWGAAWGWLTALRNPYVLGVCNPFRTKAHCIFVFNSDEFAGAMMLAIAALPMFLLIASRFSRAAAWRSWAAALPDAPYKRGRVNPRRARRHVGWLQRNTARRLLVVAIAPIGLIPFVTYMLLALDLYQQPLVDYLVLLGLLPLGLLASGVMADALLRRFELRRFRRRITSASDRAEMLTDLFAYRIELCDAAPPRREQLEQLASVLADATEIGQLNAYDRERTIEELRDAAIRAPSLTRDQRERLLGELRSCEAQIARGSA